MNRQKQFGRPFRFPKDFRLQSSKIRCPRSQQLRGNPNFSLDTAVLKYSITAIGCVNTPKYLFCLIVPLKSVRSFQKYQITFLFLCVMLTRCLFGCFTPKKLSEL